jgi:membrane protein
MGQSDSPTPEPEPDDPQAIRSLSPEARRRDARAAPARMGLLGTGTDTAPGWRALASRAVGPGTRPFEVLRRTLVGSYNDGFIHAGNLAYLSMLAIFPFFILSGFVFQMFGEVDDRRMIIETVLVAMPGTVRQVIAPVAESVIDARSGWLLWFSAGVALWTVSSLVETIRDILRRAYGTQARRAFWKNRVFSAGLIVGAVVLLLVSLFAQVAIGTAMQVIDAHFPHVAEAIGTLRASRIVPALGLFGSLYLLFYTLTPLEYRLRRYPKWPGALFTSLWWIAVTVALPPIVGAFFSYDLTYGSMAGIVIALLFFWLVGLGLVIGAELNAALVEPETDRGETPNRPGIDPTEEKPREYPRWAD